MAAHERGRRQRVEVLVLNLLEDGDSDLRFSGDLMQAQTLEEAVVAEMGAGLGGGVGCGSRGNLGFGGRQPDRGGSDRRRRFGTHYATVGLVDPQDHVRPLIVVEQIVGGQRGGFVKRFPMAVGLSNARYRGARFEAEDLDFELEVACIIWSEGIDLDESQAAEGIFGFTWT